MDMKLNQIARDVYNRKPEKQATNTFTFDAYRKELQKHRKNFVEEEKQYKDEIERIKRVYRPETARTELHKLAERRSKALELNRVLKDKLKADLGLTLSAKKDRLTSYVTSRPSPDQISLLQTLAMRKSGIDSEELQFYIPFLGDNYSTLKTLQSIAGSDSFVMPIDLKATVQALDEIEKRMTAIIERIDNEERNQNLEESEVLNYDGVHGYLTALMDEVDRSNAFSDPKRMTTLERLKNAVSVAEKNVQDAIQKSRENHSEETVKDVADALKEYDEARSFIDEHENELMTDADRSHEVDEIRSEADRISAKIERNENDGRTD